MKRSVFSLMLSLALLLTFLVPETTVYAEEGGTDTGLVTSKTASINDDGSYTITLEAYATGEKTISTVEQDVPTDIVLVLDQSGSMAYDIGTTTFREYQNAQNSTLYGYRHNGGQGNLWYQLEDGSYASVSVLEDAKYSYTPIPEGTTNSRYYQEQANLFALVNGEPRGVSVTEKLDWSGIFPVYVYTYTLWNGAVIAESRGWDGSPQFSGIDGNVLYMRSADSAETTYIYFYTDTKGEAHQIGTSKGGSTVFSPTLYERRTSTSGGGTRLAAIKTAASAFVNSVAAKAAGADGKTINHRIAVVGFASESGNGNNTELLSIRGRNSGNVGVAYNSILKQNWKDVLQSMDTDAGKTMVNNAINALSAEGATRVDLGLDMAKRILEENPVNTGEKRNRVVIVFTDGSPTDSNGFEKYVANSAISKAQNIKNMGATVYAIGVFSGADATSGGREPNGDLSQNSQSLTAACNWFMHKVSSNNGAPRSPSYYLSAADAGSLSSIFQQIADQIETGGSSSALTDESVVRDLVSPQFTLPQGATESDIVLETYACTGKDSTGAYTWQKNNDAMGAKATVNDRLVSVTGFNFSKNYVGTVTQNGKVTYRGNKLVISFKVYVREGFLGGNNVPTNGMAGVYEDKNSEFPIQRFESPTVNVPIKAIVMGDESENVYLKGSLERDQLLYNTEAAVGSGIQLQLNKADENFGLESWQTEYVDIQLTVKDAGGQEITGDFTNLTEDVPYSVTVSVSPKTEAKGTSLGAAATAQTASDQEQILVFKPVLTFRDTEGYYGETAAADFTDCLVSTVWKHGELVSTDENVLMIGEEPKLDLVYTADATKLKSGKYTKQDMPVAVTVSIDNSEIGEYTTFVHQDCEPKCGWAASNVPGNPAFLVHIRTCALTVTKTGGAVNEPYVFDVLKDGVKYSEVTIWGDGSETLYELPVGTYTIAEKTPWSWRYTPDYGAPAALTPEAPEGTLTCTNTKTVDTWLNGFSAVLRNIYGFEN